VIVSVPEAPAMCWPIPVTAVPLMVTPPTPSGELSTIVPVFVSLESLSLVPLPSAISPEPAGSPPLRAGRPFSNTDSVAFTTPAGLSGV
jgi:hypothetical protein